MIKKLIMIMEKPFSKLLFLSPHPLKQVRYKDSTFLKLLKNHQTLIQPQTPSKQAPNITDYRFQPSNHTAPTPQNHHDRPPNPKFRRLTPSFLPFFTFWSLWSNVHSQTYTNVKYLLFLNFRSIKKDLAHPHLKSRHFVVST